MSSEVGGQNDSRGARFFALLFFQRHRSPLALSRSSVVANVLDGCLAKLGALVSILSDTILSP